MLVVGRALPEHIRDRVDTLVGLDMLWCLSHSKIMLTTSQGDESEHLKIKALITNTAVVTPNDKDII